MAADEALIFLGLAAVGVLTMLRLGMALAARFPAVLALIPLAGLWFWAPWLLQGLAGLAGVAAVVALPFGALYVVSAPRKLAMVVIAGLMGLCLSLASRG